MPLYSFFILFLGRVKSLLFFVLYLSARWLAFKVALSLLVFSHSLILDSPSQFEIGCTICAFSAFVFFSWCVSLISGVGGFLSLITLYVLSCVFVVGFVVALVSLISPGLLISFGLSWAILLGYVWLSSVVFLRYEPHIPPRDGLDYLTGGAELFVVLGVVFVVVGFPVYLFYLGAEAVDCVSCMLPGCKGSLVRTSVGDFHVCFKSDYEHPRKFYDRLQVGFRIAGLWNSYLTLGFVHPPQASPSLALFTYPTGPVESGVLCVPGPLYTRVFPYLLIHSVAPEIYRGVSSPRVALIGCVSFSRCPDLAVHQVYAPYSLVRSLSPGDVIRLPPAASYTTRVFPELF